MKPINCGGIIQATEDEFARLEALFARKDQRLEQFLPDTETCLQVLHRVYTRLQALGWRTADSIPSETPDPIEIIELGCTAVHEGQVGGEFTRPGVWVWEAGDSWPSRPTMWRPKAGA